MRFWRAIFGIEPERAKPPADDIEILQKKLQAMDLSRQQQEALLKAEEFQSKQREVLSELKMYAWFGRLFIPILLGGTIFGAFTLPGFVRDYLNRRIEAGTTDLEDLQLGLSYARDGQTKIALFQIEDYVKQRKSSGRAMSPDLRAFLLRVRLWLVSIFDEVAPDGSYIGADHWQELLKDPDFKRDFLEKKKWMGDSRLAEFLGYCSLKYDSSTNFVSAAEGYFKSAIDSAEYIPDKAQYITDLAMIDLIAGKEQDSVKKFLEASAYDPAGHDAADRVKNRNSFLSGAEFPIWARATKRLGMTAFDQTYTRAIKELERALAPQPSPSR